jgi:hypothetical protein
VNAPSLTRIGAVLASAAFLVPLWIAQPLSAAPVHSDTVAMTVDSITPPAPQLRSTDQPLTVQLTLTASSDLHGVRVIAERGDPIEYQSQLDADLANPAPPDVPGLPIPAHPAVTVDLVADQPTSVTFRTVTSVQDGLGICFCHPAALYPLFFSAHTTVDGVDQRLGVVGTYLPIFSAKPPWIHVSWVWPLLDRPHRVLDPTLFTDDQLAAELAVGGRLDRALQVVEDVGGQVPLTLVLDPELLDEIWVMAHEPYQVSAGTKTVPGIGKDAATAWLDRLHTVLMSDPGVHVQLTPYGDPDLAGAAARRLAVDWAVPASMSEHVSDALAGRPLDSTLAWPRSGVIGPRALHHLATDGVSTVIVNSSAVTPHPAKGAVPAGLARLHAGGYDIAAVVTTPALEKYAAAAIAPSGSGSTVLPQLLAELAVRPAQEVAERTNVETYAAITAPRYVDPDVAAAVATITATSTSVFAKPIALADAVTGTLLPTGLSSLQQVFPSTLPPSTALDAARLAANELPAIGSLLDQAHDTAARAFVQSLPLAVQRAESSAWGEAEFAGPATRFAASLASTIDGITSGVRIVRPSSGSYTLASNSSPLPITVDNELPYPVRIRIRIEVPNSVAGFSWTPVATQAVDTKQKKTINIPTSFVRSGRIKIFAVLTTPDGAQLGMAQELTVRDASLGFIGVIITIVAGVVLVLALVVRFARRLRHRRAAVPLPMPPAPVGEPETGAVSTAHD